MSNSNLVTVRVPAHPTNYSVGRAGNKITRITPHHMAGVMTAAQCGNIFATANHGGSANYGIGNDGSVGLYVEECNRSWASSSPDNDNRAVTIEVSDSSTGGDWPVSDTALNKLIELCVDICRRNGIEKLVKGQNLTWHSIFTATTCPGPYLLSKMDYIAEAVNKNLIGDDLTMAQYDDLNARILKLENPMIYNWVDDNMPDWAKPTIQKLINKRYLNGNDKGELNLNDDLLRILVINDRAGVYGA